MRDAASQLALRQARDQRLAGCSVPVRIRAEPDNIVDSKAIMFECQLDGKWVKVGYVVKDILDEVHAVLTQITSVNFRWVDYITDWTRSGPGFFAGIAITKPGPWDRKVLRFKSTR